MADEPTGAPDVPGLSQRDEAEVLKSVLDTSDIATLVLGPEFTVKWVNERAEDYFGISRETFIGSDKATLIESTIKSRFERPDRYAETLIGTFGDDVNDETFECHLLASDEREERWLEHRSKPIESGELAGGRIEHYLDVSDRKRRESKLAAAKERLELATEGTDTGVWEWNLESDEVSWTESFERLAGLDPGGFEGTFDAFADRVHEADMSEVEAAIDEALDSDVMYQTEFRLRSESGDYRWVEARGQPLTEGGTQRMVGTVTDISERKQRERQYERLTERITSGYYAIDTDWTITYWNDVMVDRQGVPASERVGKNLWEQYPEIEGTVVETRFREAMESGEMKTCEFYYDEGNYWTQLQVFPDERGISVISTDISERKQREQELERNRDFLREIQEFAGIGGWEVDLRSDELKWTDEVYDIHGLSDEYEPSVDDAFAFYHPDDRPTIEDAVERASTEGEPYDLELRLRTPVDPARWVRTRGSPLYEDGEIVGIRGMIQEITRRKRRLSTVLENAPVILFRIDRDGIFTESQGQALEKMGLEPGEVVGQSVFDLYADYPDILDDIEAALDGERQRSAVEMGDVGFETEYRPVTDDDGEVREVVGVSFDITDRMAYERRLEENDAILQQLTETTDDIFWLFDADFSEIQFVNEAYEEVWGRSIDDLREDSMDFMQGVHPEDREHVEEIIGTLQSGTSTETEYRVNEAEDYERWVSVRGEPIFDESGEMVRVAGYARDVTDRKERERQLEALSEATQELSLARTPDEVAEQVVDIAADVLEHPVTGIRRYEAKSDRLVPWDASEEALALAGATEPADIGVIESETFEMDTFKKTEPAVAEDYQSLENPAHPDVPLGSLLVLPIGDYAQLSVAASEPEAFDTAEQNLLSILASNAATAFQRAEREQALETYKDNLERSNENLQEFAYVASHDLQEPLRSVTSYLDLLETEYADDLEEEAQFYVDRATSNATRMSTLIDALLEYSRVKTDEGSFEVVDSSAVLDDIVGGLAIRIDETDAKITTGQLPRVTADRNQLGQVFQNLVTNAIDHGGSPPTVEISAHETDDCWEFAVADNGPGIPEDQHDRIFEIFQQANTDGSGEAGIGLAICERIVSRHEGDIWVESDETASTFKFTIPKRRSD